MASYGRINDLDGKWRKAAVLKKTMKNLILGKGV